MESERPGTGIPRPQSKIERPTSRRGVKEDYSMEYGSYGSHRSATPGRNVLARPPSTTLFPNRISSASMTRLNTGLSPANQMNLSILQRPTTQQGIGNNRPATTRGLPMTRQIQDKRYYEGLLQLKMRDLTQEITAIMRDIDIQNKERVTLLHYDKRAKDLATELTALQGELADYNITVDKMASNSTKEFIEQEGRDLAERNESTLSTVERMFEQRQRMEQQLRKLEKEVEMERKHTEKLVESMDASMRQRYNELYKQKIELQESIDIMQEELEELSKEQEQLEEQIALSPVKQEAVKFHIMIMEAEEKRKKLKEEEKKKLLPETEKESLLQKIKQDNMDIAAAEAQLADKKKRIIDVERELEQLEADLEDTQIEKQSRYKELRKREEVMEQFMSTFDVNKMEEVEKMNKLEQLIVEYLETLSNAINNDVPLTISNEMSILNSVSLYEDYERTNHDRSFDALSKDYVKLRQTLNRLENLEQKLRSEAKELNERVNKNPNELIVLQDAHNVKVEFETKHEDLMKEHETLVDQQLAGEEKLKAVQEEYNKMKEHLNKNETYSEIDSLEKRLEKITQEYKRAKNFILEQKERTDYISRKEHACQLMKDYNRMLRENLKSE